MWTTACRSWAWLGTARPWTVPTPEPCSPGSCTCRSAPTGQHPFPSASAAASLAPPPCALAASPAAAGGGTMHSICTALTCPAGGPLGCAPAACCKFDFFPRAAPALLARRMSGAPAFCQCPSRLECMREPARGGQLAIHCTAPVPFPAGVDFNACLTLPAPSPSCKHLMPWEKKGADRGVTAS